MEKKLIIISGASGSGKSRVSQYIHEKYGINKVTTHTTRPKRINEINGKDYYFENEDSFFENDYLEYVKYGNYYYGSSREGLELAWEKYDVVSIILDTKGVETYYANIDNSRLVSIYLEVSNPEVLVNRMKDRGDDHQKISERINSAEYHRDLEVPDGLKDKINVINNENWAETTKKIDEIIRKL